MTAYKFLGLVLVLALSIGIYNLVISKYPNKGDLANKMMFGSSNIVGIFAVHTLFGKPEYTLFAAIFEVVFFVIFSTL
jgi:hypothetical protein